VAAACEFTAAEDGTFWMEWTDVKQYFDGGGVCFTKFNWFDYRVKGAFVDGFPTLALEIRVTKPTQAFLIISQKDKRGLPRDSPDAKYAAMMLSVCRPDGPEQVTVHLNSTTDADQPSEKFTFMFARDLSLLYAFEPSPEPYVVVPRIYDAGASKDFVIGMITEHAMGDGIEARFVELPRTCDVFKNHLSFDYAPGEFKSVEREFQYNPEVGTAVTSRGPAFVNA